MELIGIALFIRTLATIGPVSCGRHYLPAWQPGTRGPRGIAADLSSTSLRSPVTTVGYGDIVPVSARARWIDALLVTPVRMFMWFIFLGTAYELLVQRVVEDFRMHRLQSRLDGHVVICGYGTVGRFAAAELVRQGRLPADVVVIDNAQVAADQAAALGHTTLHGSATREEILQVAGVSRASAIVVCMNSDEATALVVLTARELSNARIVAMPTHLPRATRCSAPVRASARSAPSCPRPGAWWPGPATWMTACWPRD